MKRFNKGGGKSMNYKKVSFKKLSANLPVFVYDADIQRVSGCHFVIL